MNNAFKVISYPRLKLVPSVVSHLVAIIVDMSFFSAVKNAERFCVVIDVGSGSVLVAIVHSVAGEPHPNIVWSHREQAPLRDIDSIEQSAKAVMSALMRAVMLVESDGRKALVKYKKSAQLTELQCAISAPWSYTVTKKIDYTKEEPFEITETLIDDLKAAILQQVTNDLKSNEALSDLNLGIVTRATMDLLANDYRVENPIGSKTSSLSVMHSTVISQQYLIEALNEAGEKLFSEAECHKLSFILVFFVVTRELLSSYYDMCLIDITNEATEMGIIRDGSLTYCTHTSFGSNSIAREISAITGVPLATAASYLHSAKPYSFIDNLPAAQKKEIEIVFDAYIERLADLFKETGDVLAIPKNIAVHSDLESEPLFEDLIKKASKRAVKQDPAVTLVSETIIERLYNKTSEETTEKIPRDTALLLSAQFFHMKYSPDNFEYL